jgi:hypothetical protein
MATREEIDARPGGAPQALQAKPPELEDWLNARIYHPLSGRLAAALEPTGITPNMVSAAAGAAVVLAGALYVGLAWPWGLLLGFLAHASWHVLDGADGDLARRTGKASAWGEMVDGISDYLSHFILYWIIGIALAQQVGWWAYPLGFAAGISRVVQSNHAEGRRRIYLWRVYGVPWLKQARPTEPRGGVADFVARLGAAYVEGVADRLTERVDALVTGAADPERGRRLCRRASRLPLRLQTILGANLRTVALGLSMATGSALWFFLYEAVLMNLVLIWSMRLQRRCDEALAARLA